MSLKQAAEQALEALRYTTDHLPAKTGVERKVDDAITTLQVALAQSEREWVGLTNADKHEAFDDIQEASEGFWEFADYLEAKLKEKNI